MARRARIFLEGAVYYVTFRGNGGQDIFLDVRDRRHLLEKLAGCRDTYRAIVHAYGLMPGHAHLLVETPMANLDRFMGSLLTGYTVFFNRRHGRSGHLFRSRYAAQLVAKDEHLLKLSRHLHLNPVQTAYWKDRAAREKADFLKQYAWSSYRSYIGRNKEPWLERQTACRWLACRDDGAGPEEAYAHFTEAALSEPDHEFVALMKRKPAAIGPADFRLRVQQRHDEAAGTRLRQEDVIRRKERIFHAPEEVLVAVKKITGAGDGDLLLRMQRGPERAFLARALQKFAGLTQRDAAGRLGLTTGAAVSSLIKRHAGHPSMPPWEDRLAGIMGTRP